MLPYSRVNSSMWHEVDPAGLYGVIPFIVVHKLSSAFVDTQPSFRPLTFQIKGVLCPNISITNFLCCHFLLLYSFHIVSRTEFHVKIPFVTHRFYSCGDSFSLYHANIFSLTEFLFHTFPSHPLHGKSINLQWLMIPISVET